MEKVLSKKHRKPVTREVNARQKEQPSTSKATVAGKLFPIN